MKLILLTALIVCTGFSTLAQKAPNKEFILKFSNRVSPSAVIHTINVFDESSTAIISDEQGMITNSEIDAVLQRIKLYQGVTRASFDAATKTISVLTDNSADMKKVVEDLNKLNDHE